jgi:ankyrin repeat protein
MAKNDVKNFCRAMWRHDAETIARLASRVDPNARDPWGNTPLLMAAKHGDLALVSLLITRSGKPDQDRKHLTPITYAAKRGAADIVAVLRKKGATVSILTSIYLGDITLVADALKRDRSLAVLRDEEETPILHHAVEALCFEAVAMLLKHGAKIDDTDPNGETALHRIADMRQAPQDKACKMATMLIDHGAAVDARNWDAVTPLHQAARARNLSVARVLLARGADANARDKSRGSTPLRRAVSTTGAGGTAGTADLMLPLTRLLLAHGADADACDKRGVPVHASARDAKIIALLGKHRAGEKTDSGRRKRRPKQ